MKAQLIHKGETFSVELENKPTLFLKVCNVLNKKLIKSCKWKPLLFKLNKDDKNFPLNQIGDCKIILLNSTDKWILKGCYFNKSNLVFDKCIHIK